MRTDPFVTFLAFSTVMSTVSAMKTVLVMGCSYGGARAARVLAQGLPEGYSVVVIERNSHANHLYVLPRYAIIPDHEHKAFIPYNNLFNFTDPVNQSPNHSPHRVIHGTITSLKRNHVTYVPAAYSAPSNNTSSNTLEFNYAVYALGATLPAPIDLWGARSVFEKLTGANLDPAKQTVELVDIGTKPAGIEWLKSAQGRLKEVSSVLVVGGGALGIQFATDLKDVYPCKNITLLHSRAQLLPHFPVAMHNEINNTLHKLGVDVILGQRLDLKTTLPENTKYNEKGERVVRTVSGQVICAELILLCTGQTPNSRIMQALAPRSVDPASGLIRVLPSLQVISSHGEFELVNQQEVQHSSRTKGIDEIIPHIFAIGDSADTFGAINAGHTAYFQGEVAAKNILALIQHTHSSHPPILEDYIPTDPAIKVSLGRKRYVSLSGADAVLQVGDDGKDDLAAPSIWPYYGADFEKEEWN
ncbi:FAD/NAD(P)-binding domain-containing protein [Ceratobasidium sp. AG-I]|nr:FAD/NAD(P)-binding domain-containing protein [Ceratobasidium sp. AG-I]